MARSSGLTAAEHVVTVFCITCVGMFAFLASGALAGREATRRAQQRVFVLQQMLKEELVVCKPDSIDI
jgi:hypothetical protein